MSSADFTTLIASGPSSGDGYRTAYDTAGTGRAAPPAVARRPLLGGKWWEACKAFNYKLAQSVGRFAFFNTMNVEVVRPEAAERPGGYVLAPTHFSHLEPFCLGILVRRKVDWMARIEFFRRWFNRALLKAVDSFPVNRDGVPVSSIRAAIGRARAGRIVGIFPEGGVATGAKSVCRGGPLKKGACVVAQRADVPIIPCVVLGTHRLNAVLPWIPWRRSRLWVIYGRPINPRPDAPGRRQAREEIAAELQEQYQSLYRELCHKYGLCDGEIP
jgi:1-acyl-sn-glycerol-3-phosphate acyltransferase